jgi:hypothetical protein
LENEHLRASIHELESRQAQCEGKLSEMMVSAQEYAHLLEEAQDTIHSLSEPRLESAVENIEISPGRSRSNTSKKDVSKVHYNTCILPLICSY